MKSLWTLQPYQVGSKDRKSLAIIIPAQVTKQYNIDKSTIFALQVDDDKKRLMFQMINKVTPNNPVVNAAAKEGLSTR